MSARLISFQPRYHGGPEAGEWLARRLARPGLAGGAGWASVEFATDEHAVAAEGPHADRTWPELTARFGADLAGSKGLELAERGLVLSVAFAGAPAGSPVLVVREAPARGDKQSLGPAAAWVVVEAQADSRNYFGRRRGLADSEFVAQFRRWPGVEALEDHRAESGQVVVAPPRLPHALGKGVVAYYAAVRTQGDEGVMSPTRTLDPLTAAASEARLFVRSIGYIEGMNAVTWLCAASHFAVVRLDLRAPRQERMRPGSSFVVLTALQGTGIITSGAETETLAPAKTIVVAASNDGFRLSPGSEGLSVLKTWVPDHASEIEQPLFDQDVTRRELEGLFGFFGRP
jgi:hypothetical protein